MYQLCTLINQVHTVQQTHQQHHTEANQTPTLCAAGASVMAGIARQAGTPPIPTTSPGHHTAGESRPGEAHPEGCHGFAERILTAWD